MKNNLTTTILVICQAGRTFLLDVSKDDVLHSHQFILYGMFDKIIFDNDIDEMINGDGIYKCVIESLENLKLSYPVNTLLSAVKVCNLL